MTTIKGYKLVCEWCEKESIPVFEDRNPDKEGMPPSKIYFSTGYYTSEWKDNPLFPPVKEWKEKSLSKVTPVYEKGAFGREYLKEEKWEYKYIFFCSEKHLKEWERVKDIKCNNEGWK